MKKRVLLLTLICAVFLAVGCNKKTEEKDISLSINKVKVNSLLIRKDGSIQSSAIETFQKEYYNKEELQQFIEKKIGYYNAKYGEDSVTLHSLEEKDENAILVLNYKSMEDYERLYGIETKHYTMEEAIAADVIPDTMKIVDKDGQASKQEVEENQNCKVVIVNEELDVIVNGTILYYDNGAILNKTTMQSIGDGRSVIVYK